MSGLEKALGGERLTQPFTAAVNGPRDQSAKKKAAPPFSIRFTEEERARLTSEARKQPLAAYIRSKLFGDKVSARPRRPRRRSPLPHMDQIALGKVLGELGQSRLASNMNQIAKAANMGALPATPELEQELYEACAAIRDMRHQLIGALGIRPEER